jgi:OTU domain-containing protein 5
MHDEVRERCLNYMSMERDHFGQFITEEFDDYVQRKRKDFVFGNSLEMQAISEMYNRPIEVYSYSTDATTVLQKDSKMPPIRLSYHNGCHYNSVVDPKNHHVGLGLGLPESKETGGRRDILEGEGDLDDEEVTRRILVQQARDLEQQDLEEALVQSTIETSLIGWEEEGHHLDLQFEQMCLEQTLRGCETMTGNGGNGDESASAGAAFSAPRGG